MPFHLLSTWDTTVEQCASTKQPPALSIWDLILLAHGLNVKVITGWMQTDNPLRIAYRPGLGVGEISCCNLSEAALGILHSAMLTYTIGNGVF